MLGPPPLGLFAVEQVRAVRELARFRKRSDVLKSAKAGDGHPVLVLPGLLAGDSSTAVMRRFLSRLGYDVHRWKLGINLGPSFGVLSALNDRIRQLSDRRESKVTLIGWSAGGLYARELARLQPDRVRAVITMASNFRDVSASRVVALTAVHPRGRLFQNEALRAHFRTPLSVPTTSIFSKTDGIVNWEGCLVEEGPMRENIEVACCHTGMGFHPKALRVLADRLAQPEGQWRPFRRPSSRQP